MPAFKVTVAGTPRPQGSKPPLITAHNRTISRTSPQLALWRNSLVVAFDAHIAATGWTTLTGPAAAHLLFLFRRPGSHSKRRRLEDVGTKYDGADVDKLTRAVFDALEIAKVVDNDRQICLVTAAKRYADGDDEAPGVTVAVFDLNGAA